MEPKLKFRRTDFQGCVWVADSGNLEAVAQAIGISHNRIYTLPVVQGLGARQSLKNCTGFLSSS